MFNFQEITRCRFTCVSATFFCYWCF